MCELHGCADVCGLIHRIAYDRFEKVAKTDSFYEAFHVYGNFDQFHLILSNGTST